MQTIEAARFKTRRQIDVLIAERFPRPDAPTRIRAIPTPNVQSESGQLAPGPVAVTRVEDSRQQACDPTNDAAISPPSPTETLDLTTVASTTVPDTKPTRIQPLAPQRFALQVTISGTLHDKLRKAQELMSHANPSLDVAIVLERALDALIPQLEKQKFAATRASREARRNPKPGARFIPSTVKRAVRERDGDQCTFVADDGQRCPACTLLEYDRIVPISRGGKSTIDNLRLRCRAHNQYEAERAFGVEFMAFKRAAARTRRDVVRQGTGIDSGQPGRMAGTQFCKSLDLSQSQ